MENLKNMVSVVTIDGKKVSFVYLRLEQEFNHHHTFEIHLNYRVYEEKWMTNPAQIIKLVGTEVTIHLLHKDTGASNFFSGTVSKVTFVGRNGIHNQVSIVGSSPTMALDGNKVMNSYVEKTLKDMVTESVASSGNGAEVKVNPLFGSSLDYFCQYRESCFGFLNRLSWLYGEWFYYDGSNILFGKPENSETVELSYGADLADMNFFAGVLPSKFGGYAYLGHDCSEVDYTSKDEDVDVVGYAKTILGISSSIYGSDGIIPMHTPISSKNDLETLVKIEKSRAVAQMLGIQGRSSNCAVGIGKKIHVKLSQLMDVPVKDVDTFWVKKVVHEIKGAREYSNYFEAFVADVEYVPMEPVLSHYAVQQLATVMDNADSKGRVKVQFQWQKAQGKSTNWIRVQSPDAGNSDKGPRGSVFVPETGDQVMIGFEYGDPNHPYVMGSLFPENIATGGGTGNRSKTMTTRSGNQVKLDDETGDVTIVDQTGNNLIVIDGKDKISISSTKTIEISNGTSSIKIDEDDITISALRIEINGGEKVAILSQNEEMDITGNESIKVEGKQVTIKGPDIALEANNSMKIEASELNSSGSSSHVIDGGIVKINS